MSSRSRMPWFELAFKTPLWSIFAMLSLPVLAATDTEWGGAKAFQPDLSDKESLQRGLNLYANFCIGCHSLKFQRFERTAEDLGSIPEDLMLSNVIFSGQKIGEHMLSSMSTEDAKKWFGAAPPDLTMVTRVRDPEWVFNFLRAFYKDESRPFGVNNKVFPNVGMPHALLMLQGVNEELCVGFVAVDMLNPFNVEDGAAAVTSGRDENCQQLENQPGTGVYTPEEYDQAAADIANFLHYVGDPTREEREALGSWVIGFLLILLVAAWLLNRNYWRDIRSRPSDEA